MANTSPDDVAELKQELAQFLLTEITSAQGAQTFRKEVGDQVAAVIDQILNERLTPALQAIERQAAEQMNQLTARVDAALRHFEQSVPAAHSPETERKLDELAARLDEMRARLARSEEHTRRAVAQPIRVPEAKLADERIAVAPATTSAVPRWALWVIIALLALTAVGIANIYYERLMAPAPIASAPPEFVQPSASTAPAATTPSSGPAEPASGPPPAATPPAPAAATTGAATPPVSVPPQNPLPNPAVTPASNTTTPAAPPAPPPHGRTIPADFAIERGWLAAQPFAVERAVARHAGSNESITTLKTLVCGRALSCTSDALLSGSEAKQLIVLQMLMSQIGDRFCNPRRSVSVTGEVSGQSLAEMTAVATCAGAAAYPCKETQNKVCAPDVDSLQAGDAAARAQLLRWALWKTGST